MTTTDSSTTDGPIIEPRPPSAKVLEEQLLIVGVYLRFNIRARTREYRQHGGPWRPVTDLAEGAWFDEIAATYVRPVNKDNVVPYRWRGEPKQTSLDALYHSKQVDPFLEWIDSLAAWDGTPRLASWLTACFPYLDEHADTRLRDWAGLAILTGAVERAFWPGSKIDVAPVLVGPPGLGKTTALAWLFPEDHREAWHGSAVLDIRPQTEGRVIEATTGRVIVEAGELAGLRRASVAQLKDFLTKTTDTWRLAYDRHVSAIPRRFVVVGTANPVPSRGIPYDVGLLRRFLPVEFDDLDPPDQSAQRVREYLDANRVQLWAEAVEYVQDDRPTRLPAELQATAVEQTARYRATDETAEGIADHLQDSEGPILAAGIAQQARAAQIAPRAVRDSLRARGLEPTRQRIDGKLTRIWIPQRQAALSDAIDNA